MERATTTYSMGRAGRVHTSLEAPRVGFLGLGWIGRHRMQALLATGAVNAALAQLGAEVALAFLAAMGLLGVFIGRSLPEVGAGARSTP